MATYTEIKGQDIQVVSSDPSPLVPGQIWYNSTSNTLKAAIQCTQAGSAAWTTGGAMISLRGCLAGAGTNTAALAFGGGAPAPRSCTESYNGTSWTAKGALGALGTARSMLAGAGASNTAALAFGGISLTATVACTESYNGTSWTAGGALANARYALAGAGTNTAALAFGGAGTYNMCTESYNGTSWTAGGALATGRRDLAGAGTNTAALAFGGDSPNDACTESYNGTSWTTGGAMNVARRSLAGAGTDTAALAFGGVTTVNVACTESYSAGSPSTVTCVRTLTIS